jgi:hypothetical protein
MPPFSIRQFECPMNVVEIESAVTGVFAFLRAFGKQPSGVADDEECRKLGMHYTSVPNILKMLRSSRNNGLRLKLEETGANSGIRSGLWFGQFSYYRL